MKKSLLSLALLSLAGAPVLFGSCEKVDGCEYTGSCASPGGAGAGVGGNAGESTIAGSTARAGSGGAIASSSAGAIGVAGGFATGGVVGGGSGGGSSVAGGAGGERDEPAGAAGTTGAAGGPACEPACAGSTPVCDPEAGECVECLEDEHCSGTTPLCNAASHRCIQCRSGADCGTSEPACDPETHACVGCVVDADCSAEKPVCDSSAHRCVECLSKADCSGATALCDTSSHRCVQCLASNDCADAKAPVCESGVCKPCKTNDDCGHIAQKNVCDAGACVQCNPYNESACNGKSCNPATKRCTSTPVGSVSVCGACVADSECKNTSETDPTLRCVPMEYDGATLPGGYCLTRVTKGCAQPFLRQSDAVASLSGASAEKYCTLNSSLTRCEAVLDFVAAETCKAGQDSDCGCARDVNGACTAPGSGGLCRELSGGYRCTYSCGTATDCPAGEGCSIDQPYCGGASP